MGRKRRPSTLMPIINSQTQEIIGHIDLGFSGLGYGPGPGLPGPPQPRKKRRVWPFGLFMLVVAATAGYIFGPLHHGGGKPKPAPSATSQAPVPGRLTASSTRAQVAAATARLLNSGDVVADPRVCDGNVRGDLLSGNLYYKGVNFLEEVTEAGFKLSISCVKSGHSSGGLHPVWKAYDVNKIDGQYVCSNRADNPHQCTHDAQVRKFGQWLLDRLHKQGPQTLPYMIGGPESLNDKSAQKYSGAKRDGPYFYGYDEAVDGNGNHEDHFHLGFECDPNHPDDFCSKGSESIDSLKAAWKASPWD